MVKLRNKEYRCAMELALELIGGKWKVLILWRLSQRTLRFGELRKLIPHATQKMMTQQLRDLEEDGLIFRQVYAQVPLKVEYSLTDYGRSALPVLQLMYELGNEYIKRVEKTEIAMEVDEQPK